MTKTQHLLVICLVFLQCGRSCQCFLPVAQSRLRTLVRVTSAIEEHLMEIAHKLKLEVFDVDDGIYGFDSKDQRYGLEVIKTNVRVEPSLGLELTQLAQGASGQGLVLISGVDGNAAQAKPKIQIGDAITGIIAGSFKERTIGLDYDNTVEIIGRARQASANGMITLQLNRLIPRARVTVEVDDGKKVYALESLAGENLRTLLMRKQVKLYDPKTKRFDQPFSTGDCAGEGICGTCLVNVVEGADLLSAKDDLETFITKGRPAKWRAACRTIINPGNKSGGKVRIRTHPQTELADELDPGVKDVSMQQKQH